MVSEAPTLNLSSISEMTKAILSSRICGPLILVWYSLPSIPNQIPSMGFLIKGLTWTSLKPESLHRRTGREVKRYASHPSGTFRYVVAMASRSSSGSSPSRGPREKLRSLRLASERRGSGRRGLADWLLLL